MRPGCWRAEESLCFFFFFNDTATTEIYTLSLHDALPISVHPLIAQGYPSIGCAPCTSQAAANDGIRSGRWIDSQKTECGIHRAKWVCAEVNAEQESVANG